MNERPDLSKELQAATSGVEPHDVLATPEDELFADPTDFSAVGGPESEPAYGRTRAMAGEYPFNEHGGPYDRDEPSHVERGGIQTHHHAPDPTTR
jgi:hypothetical protein